MEACAGSGKTWLLVSRILRLLLDGAAPGEILVSSAIVQKLSEPGLSVDAGRWVTLKGIPEACLVFSLPWRSKRESFEKPSAWSPAHEAMCLAFGSVRETGSESDAPSCMLGPRGQA